jgi:hypothetical protein
VAAQRYHPNRELDLQRQRRKTRVVVRSADPARRKRRFHELPVDVSFDRRRPLPTLLGLGEPEPAPRREPPPPTRSPRREQADVRQQARPEVLLDGVDDALARAYRAEADRILASGIFPRAHESTQEPAETGLTVGRKPALR